MKTVRRPPYPKWNPGYFPCSSLTPPSAFLTPSIGVLRWIQAKYSRRLIHLDDQTVGVVTAHLARQAEWRLKLGPAYQDRGFMFASPSGGLLDPDNITKAWQRIRRQIGVTCRLHDLRHAHATTLIEAGVHIKAVQARLGHSSPSFTMAVYAHVSPQMDKDAAQAYADAMR